jgi:DNA-binding transcriptional LysR family regulator
MDTQFLANFLLVVDTGSFAEAARRLDLTAAAIAQQMRTLERELSVKLLARSGRTVRPTEAGYRLVERSRDLLQDLVDLKMHVNAEPSVGELRLGTINTALHSIVPDMMALFATRYPQVNVTIRFDTSMALYRSVQAGELDAAVCLHPPFALTKNFAWEQLREEPLVVLVPMCWKSRDAHELLRNEPLIRYDRTLGGGRQADRYLRRHDIVPRERFELNSLVAIAMMVERRLGVSLIPDTASPLTASLNVARIALPDEAEKRRFGIIWPRSSARLHIVEGLIAAATEVMETIRTSETRPVAESSSPRKR